MTRNKTARQNAIICPALILVAVTVGCQTHKAGACYLISPDRSIGEKVVKIVGQTKTTCSVQYQVDFNAGNLTIGKKGGYFTYDESCKDYFTKSKASEIICPK